MKVVEGKIAALEQYFIIISLLQQYHVFVHYISYDIISKTIIY